MSEHSPGPWKACHGGECQCGFIWAADGEIQVASVHGPSALGQDWYGSDTVCNHETQKANARLIEAGPELLEALNKIASDLDELVADEENIPKVERRTYAAIQKIARAAIAKTEKQT